MFTVDLASRLLDRALQILIAVIAFLVAFLVLALAPSAMAEDTASLKNEVIRLVNVERTKAGVPALHEDEKLIEAANQRAEEASRKFSHVRPNGSKWKTIFNEFEVQSTCRGENLAYGHKSPKAVVKAWMASEAHRSNILSEKFDGIAVGVYTKKGVLYWSQLFIRNTAVKTIASESEQIVLTGVPVAADDIFRTKDLDLNVRAFAHTRACVF